MTTFRNAGAIAAALLVTVAGAAAPQASGQTSNQPSSPAQNQPRTPPQPKPASNSPLDRRGTVLNQQTVKRWTSSENQRYALPSIKLKGIGVKSQAPRGIGKVNGSLLPDVVDSPTPTRSGPAIEPVVWRGGGDPFAVTVVRGGTLPMPVYVVDPAVLASGDNVAIARMLRPSVDYRNLSVLKKLLLSGFMTCRAMDWFNTDPDPYAFAPDGYSGGDPNKAGIYDPFVLMGNPPTATAPAPANLALADNPEYGLTAFEKAGNRLYDGKPEEAIVLLRGYVAQNLDDAEAARALALALIDARRTKDGVELVGRVYEENPELASSVIPADAVGPESEMRDLVIRAVEHAHKVNTPAAWLTVAMLMQAEGRNETALKMIDRADAVNLSPDVSTAMRAALKP